AIISECEKIVEQYHKGDIDRTEAVLKLALTIPDSTTVGSPGSDAFAQYHARLEEEDERNQSAARKGKNAQIPRAQTPPTRSFVRAASPSDDFNIKRVKLDEQFLPWVSADSDAEQRLGENLNRTRLQLAEFQKDPRTVLNSVLNATHRISFPESEWLAIIKGHSVNFDKVHSHRLSLASSYKATRRIAQGLDFVIEDPEPPNKVRSQGDWENVWYLFFQACTFIFPHRADELRAYHEWIHHRFEACNQSIHQRVINLDNKIRTFAASRRDVALDQPSKFSHFEGSYLHEWGTGHAAASRSQEKTFSGGSTSGAGKVQAACNRFNEERCKNTSTTCRYLHVCSKCKRTGHTMAKC
ncbi:hypothetical protein M378DRAFT_63633, partial [Amanita muscaria Koide BX008]